MDSTSPLTIQKGKNSLLTVEFAGQWRTSLSYIGKDRFRLEGVRPKAILAFNRDSLGSITGFNWVQAIPKFTYQRIFTLSKDSLLIHPSGRLSRYVGNYRLGNNPQRFLKVRIENDRLTAQHTGEGKLTLKQISENQFMLFDKDLKLVYNFIPDNHGNITTIAFSRIGAPEFVKTNADPALHKVYGFNRSNGFTRADTLRGKLTPLRACYDVLFYDLNVTVDPASKSIRGNNTIRFKAVNTFDRVQVDLFENMNIEKILYRGTSLSFRREFNAVFIEFPTPIQEGTVDEIIVLYSGRPQTPDGASLAGGIFWLWDKEGEYWIETVTQGSGASLWWPCKDHLSDKPDSMKINVTVPRGLSDISNGRLLRKTEVPGNQTRFEWHVSYPITPYGVVMNIGNYTHFSDKYISGNDTLVLNYYCMPHDQNVAKAIFKHTKPMLALFEKSFGRYPFWRDGFTVMQSIYPMEHQSAVSVGSIFNPFNSDRFDSLDVIRTMWHECAHEWWGNHVTVKDMADLWLHESFATYAEALAYEKLQNRAAMMKYLKDQKPGNNGPMLGKIDVNDFRLGDIYSKGLLMLHTLRNLIDNDSVWFDLLRGMQAHFAFQTVTTHDIVSYINNKTGTDYTYFFEQYLTKASIPKLQLAFTEQGSVTHVKYRWDVEVEKFDMPIKVTATKNIYTFIYPTRNWKDLDLGQMKTKEFKVDTDNFYIDVQNINAASQQN
ncbi:M1 family metallopeptidase [Chryseolinea lacunae]|uniref:M1 family peptidase n=1 Tax=Chryseolinea lacunae TaxID=2801331 RepID=A0ABS1KWH3_9BACT|nr:M1 family metallopeptidase [Chryseolinea lacunae]MBL0743032.1 M1 family peptidase [Chryseolinea lacunae]